MERLPTVWKGRSEGDFGELGDEWKGHSPDGCLSLGQGR